MKKGIVALVVGLLLVVGVCVTVALAQDKQDTKKDWSRLKVVTYSSGLTGFFDPDSGKLYIYDANMENCFIVRQLVKLGDPLVKIKN